MTNNISKVCVVIPVYNHHQSIDAIIHYINSFSLPVFLVDDGSDTICKNILKNLSQTSSNITLLVHKYNQGKGAAVIHAMRTAYKKGFTHALQIDADGQHNCDHIPLFLEMCNKYPESIIAGVRDYEDMPASRRHGRRITDVWVWINTLTTHIKDSMCGFRLYPLKPLILLIDKVSISSRMDFDTDILVRLYWLGVKVKHVNVTVIYGDAPSHFDLWRDNIRISKMHAKLFFGMLKRFPKLILFNINNRHEDA